ncbi:ABC transporter [Xylariales sp. AK1849]|nr:ABC transporter [Xylariales sp. AK1849]
MNISSALCVNDHSFGPAVRGCRGDFDFTVAFESIVFDIIPAGLFIVLCAARIIFLLRQPAVVNHYWMRLTKLIVTVTYAILQLILLVFATRGTEFRGVFVVSSVVLLASSIGIIALSALEHSRAVKPSLLLSVYLIVTLLFDAAQARTLWLSASQQEGLIYSRLWISAVAVKAILALCECKDKSKHVQWGDEEYHSPEETSGLIGLAVFSWLYRLFVDGYRKHFALGDLLPLDRDVKAEPWETALLSGYQTSESYRRQHGLAKSLARVLSGPVSLPVLPRLALIGFRVCQPLLINKVLNYIQNTESLSPNVGYGLIGASILVYGGVSISSSLYWYFQERAMFIGRGALAGAIYRKTTQCRLSSYDDAALTLMSTDTERIRIGLLNLHEFWASIIEVALMSWLLQRQLGIAFVAPLLIVAVCITASSLVSRLSGSRQKVWMERIQKRVGLTAGVLSSMKQLRISGLAAPVEDLLQHMRVEELEAGARFRMILLIIATIGYTPLALAPVIAFAWTSRTLDVTTIFTSVSLLVRLAEPLGMLFQMITPAIVALACLDRIQVFLDRDSRVDYAENIGQTESLSEDASFSEKLDPESIMSIENGWFSWDAGKPCLRDISLQIPVSGVIIVIGPVGCGKSSLCKAFLREIPMTRGRLLVQFDIRSHTTGYCDQSPDLRNTTIRDNIVGFEDSFEAKRYEDVIRATMLEHDLAVLELGDQTVIGSNGVMLSGGQKQRVCMARALYHVSDLYIFDDVLSGLDADTQNQVFDRVFGSAGLIRSRRAAVVLCTHSTRYLASADHVVVMGADGSIVEQGSYAGLRASQNSTLDLISDMTSAEKINHEGIQTLHSTQGTPNSLARSSKPAPSQSSIDGLDSENTIGDSVIYRYYLTTLGRQSIAAFLIFGLGYGFLLNWVTIWLKFWSEDMSSAYPAHSNTFYISLYALFQVLFLACIFFVMLICFRTMISTSGARLHKGVLGTVIHAAFSFLTTTDTGVIINLFSQDMTLIDNELPVAVTNVALDLWSALGMAAVIATASPFLAISYLPILLFLYTITKVYVRTSKQLRMLDLESKSPLYTHYIDTVRGIASLRAFGWVKKNIEIGIALLDTSQRPAYLLAMVQRCLGFILQVIATLLAVAVVALATQLRSNGAFTGASMVTLITFSDTMIQLIRWYTTMETAISAVRRLKEFSEKVKLEDLDAENIVPPSTWPQRGDVSIRGVSASYFAKDESVDAGGDDDEKSAQFTSDSKTVSHLALANINITIKAGEKVAICGRTGSGKSSMLLLLLHIIDPIGHNKQSIVIDDLSLAEIDRSTLRQRIIAVPQEPVFLPDGTSFKSNLDPFKSSTDTEVEASLECVGLSSLVSQAGGLESGMSPGKLSQGQRQLFNIARAILRRKVRLRELWAEFGEAATEGGILLLDEVSSSVDRETERKIQEALMHEFGAYTIVMVSHRLEMVLDFETVVVMHKGSIVEVGNPARLERSGGWFANLAKPGNQNHTDPEATEE